MGPGTALGTKGGRLGMSDFEQLEKELRAINPSNPSVGFENRLEDALGDSGNLALRRLPDSLENLEVEAPEESPVVTTFRLSRILPLAAAAALAVGLYFAAPFSDEDVPPDGNALVGEQPAPVSPIPSAEEELSPLHGVSASAYAAMSAEGWIPADVTEILLKATDEGIVDRPGQSPARRYRYQYLDETVWRNPTTNTLIRASAPREEVVLIGLELY